MGSTDCNELVDPGNDDTDLPMDGNEGDCNNVLASDSESEGEVQVCDLHVEDNCSADSGLDEEGSDVLDSDSDLNVRF